MNYFLILWQFLLDTTTPMNLWSVRGILATKLGVLRSSTLLMSASLTGKSVLGFVASLDVARPARLESKILTNTQGNMLLKRQRGCDIPSLRLAPKLMWCSCLLDSWYEYLQNSQHHSVLNSQTNFQSKNPAEFHLFPTKRRRISSIYSPKPCWNAMSGYLH